MIRSLKLFAACVESLRTAEKEYDKNPTAFNKNIMVDLQKKVDAWINWVHGQQNAELARNVPPFIGKAPISGYQGSGTMDNDVLKRLMETHTPEEIEKYKKLMQGKFQ